MRLLPARWASGHQRRAHLLLAELCAMHQHLHGVLRAPPLAGALRVHLAANLLDDGTRGPSVEAPGIHKVCEKRVTEVDYLGAVEGATVRAVRPIRKAHELLDGAGAIDLAGVQAVDGLELHATRPGRDLAEWPGLRVEGRLACGHHHHIEEAPPIITCHVGHACVHVPERRVRHEHQLFACARQLAQQLPQVHLCIRLNEAVQVFHHCPVHLAGGMRPADGFEHVLHHAARLERDASVLKPLHHVRQQAGLHKAEDVVQGPQAGAATVRRQHTETLGAPVGLLHGLRGHALPAEEGRGHTVAVGELADPGVLHVHSQPADGEVGVVPLQLLQQLHGVGDLVHQRCPGPVVEQVEQRRLVAHQCVIIVEAHHLRSV
mmetsp:Transcript_23322/g.73431  ORF Transcript_23322/g.73431 Transcript_23322/m.73431 type:complete len:376 (+) Transcript_23322:386-1513(+)